MYKFKAGEYRHSFCNGGSNKILNLIMCKNKFFIMVKLQRYVLNWYHSYLLDTRMD